MKGQLSWDLKHEVKLARLAQEWKRISGRRTARAQKLIRT